MIEWDENHKCVVDYMGMPMSLTEAGCLIELLTLHVKGHTPRSLANAYNEVWLKKYPEMAAMYIANGDGKTDKDML